MAVIFGAWLMQETDLHEKQVVLLTGEDKACEELIEQQLRELTLLPLNIRYLSLEAFKKEGAPARRRWLLRLIQPPCRCSRRRSFMPLRP